MKKYKVIIVEDENLAVTRLKKMLLNNSATIEIIGLAKNGPEAVEKINNLNPDLIFLDIQIPGFNGFEVLKKLKQIPLIIFTTAYDSYALKAFETNSVDYLLKPFSAQRLKQALEKIKNLQISKHDNFHKNLENTLNQEKLENILVSVGQKKFFIKTEEIIYFEADEKYVKLHTKENNFLINKTLKELESKTPLNFFRIHRSYLINLNFAKGYRKISYRKFEVILVNNEYLPLSRKVRKEFIKKL